MKLQNNPVQIKRKVKYILAFVCIIVIMICAPIVISKCAPLVSSEITADGMLGYIAATISTIGTVILSIVAIWQTKKSTDISQRMINFEEEKQRTVVDFFPISIEQIEKNSATNICDLSYYINDECFFYNDQETDDETSIWLRMKNVTNNQIVDFSFSHLSFDIRNHEKVFKTFECNNIGIPSFLDISCLNDEMILIIPVPADIWIQNAHYCEKHQTNETDGTHLHVSITLNIENQNLVKYCETMSADFINAYRSVIAMPVMFNKEIKISKQ